MRTTDEELLKYLKIFTFIRVVEMKGIMEEHNVSTQRPLAWIGVTTDRVALTLLSVLPGDAVGPGRTEDPRRRSD